MPDAGFPGQQQGGYLIGHLRQAHLQFADGGTRAQAGQRLSIARQRLALLERALYGAQQLLQGDGLFQKIRGTDACCLHRSINGAVAGHHDHRHGQQAIAFPLLEQCNAVGVRHPDVEQHQVRAFLAAITARGAGIFRQRDNVTLVMQNFPQQLADADFVVHHQYFIGCHLNRFPAW